MESEVTPWLEASISGELLLAHGWLKNRIAQQEECLSLSTDASLYADSGSVLEITVVDKGAHALQVLKTSPLTFSDGVFFLEAVLTDHCQHLLSSRRRRSASNTLQQNSLVYLTNYIIAATTFGPAADRVYLEVDELEWKRASPSALHSTPRQICFSEEIVDRLEDLAQLRAVQDRRLAEEAAAFEATKMAHSNQDQDMEDSDLGSQGFGTQAVGLPLAAPPQSQGIAMSDRPVEQQLLGLLNPGRPALPQAPAPPRPHVEEDDEPLPAILPSSGSLQVAWMEDLQFNQSDVPTPEQRAVLERPNSLFKPGVGRKFPDANIPISELQEILATHAAEETASSPAGSWAPSEPSPRTMGFHLPRNQDLPPDSSIEHDVRNSPHNARQLHQDPPARSPEEGTDEESLASSPPEAEDDDDDMETDVPRALDEDRPSSLLPQAAPSSNISHLNRPVQSDTRGIVQVEETPYGKGKEAAPRTHRETHLATQEQTSSGSSKSTSIVYSTYRQPPSSDKQQVAQGSAAAHQEVIIIQDEDGDTNMVDATTEAKLLEQNTRRSNQPNSLLARTAPHARQEISPGSRSLKRTLPESPTKNRSERGKRRGIAVHQNAFNAPPPSDPDTAIDLYQDKQEFVKGFLEKGETGATFEGFIPMQIEQPSRRQYDAPSTSVPAEDNNANQNVAAPLSILDETHQPSDGVQVPSTYIESTVDEDLLNPAPNQTVMVAPPHTPHDGNSPRTVFDKFKAAYPDYASMSDVDAEHFSSMCQLILNLDVHDKMVPKSQWDDFLIRYRLEYTGHCCLAAERGEHPTPWLRYYKDNMDEIIYKKGILRDRATLDQAIAEIDNTPAFSRSASARSAPNLGPGTPLLTTSSQTINEGTARGRKPSLPGNLWSSAVIGNVRRKKLPRLSNDLVSSSSRSSSVSLADVRGVQDQSPQNGRGRQSTVSLTGGQRTGEPSAKGSRSSETNAGRMSGAGNRATSRGQHFRDFVLAQQRVTSWTGSTKEDKRSAWPDNVYVRPSLPGPNDADVLTWGDEL